VIADRGWDGLVVRIATRGRRFEARRSATVTAAPASRGTTSSPSRRARLAGLECLSGIPGWSGATPIQNVGAYGQEVADTIRAVTVLERAQRRVHELPADACGFGYRDSAFKRAPDRARGPGRDVRAAPGGAPRSATASSPRRSAGVARRRWRSRARRAGAAPAEIDGDRRRRSEPAQRRIVLHEPDRVGRAGDSVAARAVALGAIARGR
jgi:hypothetical protein